MKIFKVLPLLIFCRKCQNILDRRIFWEEFSLIRFTVTIIQGSKGEWRGKVRTLQKITKIQVGEYQLACQMQISLSLSQKKWFNHHKNNWLCFFIQDTIYLYIHYIKKSNEVFIPKIKIAITIHLWMSVDSWICISLWMCVSFIFIILHMQVTF